MNSLLLPTLGQPTRTARTTSRDSPRDSHLFGQGGHCCRRRGKSRFQLADRNELDVFLREVQPGLQVSEQAQQVFAELRHRRGDATGQLPQGDIELTGVAGIDHAQHRLGLREIEPSGEKCPERELARLGQPRPAAHTLASRHSKSGGEPIV